MPANTTGWWAEFHAYLNANIKPIQAHLSAVQHQEAHLNIELKKVVASLAGIEHAKGGFTAELQKISAVFNAQQSITGGIQAELQHAMAAMNAKQAQLGTLQIVKSPVIANFLGLQKQTGTISASMKKAVALINGYERPSGSIVIDLKKTNAVLVGKHFQTGTIAAQTKKTSASLSGIHKQTGTISAAFKKAVASMNGKQTQRGSIAATLNKTICAINGQFIGVTPVVIDVVGTAGSENIGNVTCSINPSANADVLVFAASGGASLYAGVFGAGSDKMRFLGRVKYQDGQCSVFLIQNVASGSQTATISASGGGWSQAVAISYKGAIDWKLVKTALGSGSTASQSAAPGSNGLAVQSFSSGDDSKPFSSLSGGTSRLNETGGFVCQTIRDNNISGTFSGALGSAPWGGVVAEATPSAITGPKINYLGGIWTEQNGGSNSFTVKCSAGDYVVFGIVQDRAGDPSGLTCDGAGVTLIDTQTFTTGVGTGFIKWYRSNSTMTAGDKTVAWTGNGSGWHHSGGVSVSGVTSFSAATKSNGTSSAPSQAMTCSAGQLILHIFGLSGAPTTIAGTNIFDSPGGFQVHMLMQASHESITFGVSNSLNWGSMGIVIS